MVDLNQLPASWEDLLKMPGLSRSTKLQLKMLQRLPMAKPMIEGMFTSMRVAGEKFKLEHGRDPEGEEVKALLQGALGSMASGLFQKSGKKDGHPEEPEAK